MHLSGLIATLIAIMELRAFCGEQLRPWESYRTIMWIGDSAWKKPEKVPLFFNRLREMGINSAMVYGGADPQPLLENHFPYYVENIVNKGLCLKFNSQVGDWDKFVTDWTKKGRPEEMLIRDYCLDDPSWRQWAREQVQTIARKHSAHSPFAYDIRDELSTTISANPFDYDFNPKTLENFRAWLKKQYRDLGELNNGWQTEFSNWSDVKPFTTDQIKNRMASGERTPHGNPDWHALQRLKFDPSTVRQNPVRWNFAPWMDFRTYMDIALADALDDIRHAAHEVDPQTPVGIEGTQMPAAFGGYDLSRLARVLDWVEPYDIGNAREIFGSFMPGRPILTTVGEKDPDHARRRLWHLLLEGDRGCIVWWSEDSIDWASGDYKLTPRANALTPILKEMNSDLAALLIKARREYDPIYVYYSQPSIQADWLLESTGDGSTWHRRFSSYEAQHNRLVRVRNSWLKLFQDLGYSPQFVTGEELQRLNSDAHESRILVLPQTLAMSDQDLTILTTSQNGRSGFQTIFADGTPGVFDEHGRVRTDFFSPFPNARSEDRAFVVAITNRSDKLAKPRLSSRQADIANYETERLDVSPKNEWTDWVASHIDLSAPVKITPAARVRVHRYRQGPARLVAFERNVEYKMSEDLKQAGGNEHLERPQEMTATFDSKVFVYDLARQQFLGETNRITFVLGPWKPAVMALLTNKISPTEIISALKGTP